LRLIFTSGVFEIHVLVFTGEKKNLIYIESYLVKGIEYDKFKFNYFIDIQLTTHVLLNICCTLEYMLFHYNLCCMFSIMKV